MAEKPWQPLLQTLEKLSNCIQTHLTNFIGIKNNHLSSSTIQNPISSDSYLLIATNSSTLQKLPIKDKSTGPVTKEELGKATWTFLHTLAAQTMCRSLQRYPKVMLSCSSLQLTVIDFDHSFSIGSVHNRSNPPLAGSQEEFSQWLCHVHNTVNRSVGKLVFPCERVDARWGKLECEQKSCDLHGTSMNF